MRPEKMALWNEFLPDQLVEEPTTESPEPTTTEAIPDDKNDTLVMILAILTGVFGAVGVTLLIVLIVICRKVPRRRQKELKL
ncbi:unnamed protein product [Porites lobata]|uniref:Uncharacterized protein n=1 Tax=Porites lobata TaxID=104759 RepID=A0ABN8RCE4_9CNID|nr:unnamed protein product [Porites lobata]